MNANLTRNRQSTPRRRGITLLFVISMIVLFLLMGTTFVVVTNDYLRGAKRRSRIDRNLSGATSREAGSAFVERAMYELIRGPDVDNTSSPLLHESLLADMYGYGFKIDDDDAVVTLHPSEQLISLVVDEGADSTTNNKVKRIFKTSNDGNVQLSDVPGFPNGQLLTVIEGDVRGLTMRVIQYDVAPAAGLAAGERRFLLQPLSGYRNLADDVTTLDGNDDVVYLLNERQFAGSGSTTGAPASPNEHWDGFDEQNKMLTRRGEAPNEVMAFFDVNASFQPFGKASAQVDNDNDGTPDGLWLDIGLPLQSTPDGEYIKPLVSYQVIDLDSHVNLNAHGNLHALQAEPGSSELDALSATPPVPPFETSGLGFGPAEISLFEVVGATEEAVMQSRYGDDDVPGVLNEGTRRGVYKTNGFPDDLTDTNNHPVAGDSLFFSELDLFGRYTLGFSTNATVLDAHFPSLIPPLATGLENPITESPYNVDFSAMVVGGPAGGDELFSASEFEILMRPNDRDSFLLDQRLDDLLTGVTEVDRKLLTFASYEVPAIPSNMNAQLYGKLTVAVNQRAALMSELLAPEVRRGMPMNLNRQFGDGKDNDGDSIVDEPDEDSAAVIGIDTDDQNNIKLDVDNNGTFDEDETFNPANPIGNKARYLFAKRLYVLMLLATKDATGPESDRAELIAQWVANIVDFRDPDSIMTPFEVDLNPWDGWGPDGDPGTDTTTSTLASEMSMPATDRLVVWGTERPELLITETSATHDRRTQDLDVDDDASGGTMADGDTDWDNHLAPTASAFFEIYNPNIVRSDLQDATAPSEFYNASLAGVDLYATAPGGAPVWRMIVVNPTTGSIDPDAVAVEQEIADDATATERMIYFTVPTGAALAPLVTNANDKAVYTDTVYNKPATAVLEPGEFAVVGSAGVKQGANQVTYMGRIVGVVPNKGVDPDNIDDMLVQDSLADTQRVELLGSSFAWYETGSGASTTRAALTLPLGVPDATYPQQYRSFGITGPAAGYTGVIGSPDGLRFSTPRDVPVDTDPELLLNGLTPRYRVVYLQRLANPLDDFNADSNPYRIVDSHAVDLFAFTGAEVDTISADTGLPDSFGTFERSESVTSVSADERLLWKTTDKDGLLKGEEDAPAAAATGSADAHVFDHKFVNSLGATNEFYLTKMAATGASPESSFPWLAWNNRPYASQYELANVPFASAQRLTHTFGAFDVASNGDPTTAPFEHLPNFADPVNGLNAVMDFVEVPSLFAGTEQFVDTAKFDDTVLTNANDQLDYWLTAPFDELPNFRYPGKININTVPDVKVWDALMGGYDSTGLTFDAWKAARRANPWRPAAAADDATAGSLDDGSAETGLFQTSGVPFGYDPTAAQQLYNDTERSAYFRNIVRQRLGSMATNRSSVFAVWVTVGYFEWDPAAGTTGDVRDKASGGNEYGAETGEVKRNRGFYIFDRSIPMAYEPGKNHNVDRGILLQSIFE